MGTKNRKPDGGYLRPPVPTDILKNFAKVRKDDLPSGSWYAVRDAPEESLDPNELRTLARARGKKVRVLGILCEAEAGRAGRATERAAAAELKLEKIAAARQRGGRKRWSSDRPVTALPDAKQRTAALAIIDRHVQDGTWRDLTYEEISGQIRDDLGISEERGAICGPDWVGDRFRERGCRKRLPGTGIRRKR